MKNSIFFLIVALIISSGCLLSCKKKVEKPHAENAYISMPPDTCDVVELKQEDFKKIEMNLMFIAYGLSEIAKSEEFVVKTHEAVRKRFDGDDNTLIRDIALSLNGDKLNFERAFDEVLRGGFHRDTINKYKLKGFPIKFEDYGLFPQVYIPSPEHTYNSKTPIIVSERESNWKYDSITHLGYSIGQRKENSFLISDEFTSKNLTWIVSINESVNCKGNINGWTPKSLPYKFDQNAKAAASVCDAPLVNKYKQIEFYPKIIVDNKKEGGNKKGELKYAFAVWCPSAYTTTAPWLVLDKPLYRSNGEYKIRTSDVGQYLDVHHHFINQPYWRDNHHIALIVYEYDWAGSTNPVFYEIPWLTYKSNETPYWTKKDYNWFSYSGPGCWLCYTITSHHNPGQILFDIGGWEPTQ